MVLILDKTDRRPHKNVVLGRVGGSLWSSIWEGVKKVAPYALPVAAPLALSWLFGKKDQQQQPQPLPSQIQQLPNIDDVYELGKSKVKQAIPPQMMEMFEMYKELSKKKKKVVDEDDIEDDEVDGSGVSKRTKRKLKSIVRGSGIRMFR